MFEAIKSLSARLIASGRNFLRPSIFNPISSESYTLFLTRILQVSGMPSNAFDLQRNPGSVTALSCCSTTPGSDTDHPEPSSKEGETHSSGGSSRLFPKPSQPLTHSYAHLEMQQERLKRLKIRNEITTLPKGSVVIGLDLNYRKGDYSLGTVPRYEETVLEHLSQGERNEWEELSKKHYAQVGHYSLICKIHCVTLFTENGEIFSIHIFQLI